jgi:hypothetical protein
VSFGQVCNGAGDDTAAIQAKLDVGGLVTLPDGICAISGVVVSVDGTDFDGRGRTSLRRIPGTFKSLISLPRAWGQHTPLDTVKDVTIRGLLLDGNHVGISPPGVSSHFGIQLIHGERITLKDLIIQDQYYDSIGSGVGYQPVRNLVITNVKIYRGERNGIHLGFADGALVAKNTVEDTPSQQWGPRAGNCIDVEVEGLNSYVANFTIEDNKCSRNHVPNAGTAGMGIAFQPAYGKIRNGIVRRNFIKDYQIGVWFDIGNSVVTGDVEAVDSVTVNNNTILNTHTWVDGYGVGISGASRIRVTNNYISGMFGPAAQPYQLYIHGGHDHVVANNEFLGRVEAGRPFAVGVKDHPASPTFNLILRNNKYNRHQFLDLSPNATGITQTDNTRY